VDEDELDHLITHEMYDPGYLVWHGLPFVRPFFMDLGGMQDPDIITSFVSERRERFHDLSPLAWALGLQQPLPSENSSPMPPPLHPPLPLEFKVDLLNQQVRQIEEHCSGVATFQYYSTVSGDYVADLRCILQQLQQQQQPEVLEGFTCLRELWQLCALARHLPAFWQLLREVPALQQHAAGLVRHVQGKEVLSLAQGLVSLGLLPQCTPEEIWWLVARLDHVTGDRGKVLMLFEQLALQQPWHGAFDHLGHLLLQYAKQEALYWRVPSSKEASDQPVPGPVSAAPTQPGADARPPLQNPSSWGEEDMQLTQGLRKEFTGGPVLTPGPAGFLFGYLAYYNWEDRMRELEPSFAPDCVVDEVFPKLTCRMSGAEVGVWLEQVQAVWPPPQSHRLLLQLLMTPDLFGMFTAADRLQLYDLLLLQLARSEWPLQQQQVMEGGDQQQEHKQQQRHHQQVDVRLPAAAAEVVLGSLPDASTSNAAASQVLVVWRHVCGTVQDHWFSSDALNTSNSTLEGVGWYVYYEIEKIQGRLEEFHKKLQQQLPGSDVRQQPERKQKEQPNWWWQQRQQDKRWRKLEPSVWDMDMLYDSGGMLSPADVDSTGSITAVEKGVATLGQHWYYSSLGPKGRSQVAAAVERLGLPVKLSPHDTLLRMPEAGQGQ
jgi:hypothetical protein